MFKKIKDSTAVNFVVVVVLLAVVGLGAYWLKDLQEPVTLYIPSQEIRVGCEYVVLPTSKNLQEVADKQFTAAWNDKYILDHAGQAFSGLWNTKPGDEIIFGTRHYRCSFITTGWSERGIEAHNREEKLPEADLYLCTCIPGGEMYEIYIVGASAA